MAIGIGKAVTTVAKPIAMNIFFFDIIVVPGIGVLFHLEVSCGGMSVLLFVILLLNAEYTFY
jgi:hypothetical protein